MNEYLKIQKLIEFNEEKQSRFPVNLLSKDGNGKYYGKIFTENNFLNIWIISWKCTLKNNEAIIYGKHIVGKRKVVRIVMEDFNYKNREYSWS